jgi:hypothetical protein
MLFLATAVGARASQVANTAAEPFGFHKGMTRQQAVEAVGASNVEKCANLNGVDRLCLRTAPKPHPAFDEYDLIFSPKEGLLKVQAIGPTISVNSYGDEAKEAFHDIAAQLSARYGPPNIADFLQAGSIWNEPKDWMMGLLKNERILASTWEWANDPHDAAGTNGITLDFDALDSGRGWLSLGYEFCGWTKFIDSVHADAGKVF